MSVIVIEFITLDGFVSDPDGTGGTPGGGWMFRFGPEQVSGDMFLLGPVVDDGVMMLGRKTWELFSKIWPGRDDPFSVRMNKVPKLVVSRTLTDASAWANSEIAADPVEVIRREERDVIITGSLSVVHPLIAAGLVDEYRLRVFPTLLGTGERLFPGGAPATELECRAIEQAAQGQTGKD